MIETVIKSASLPCQWLTCDEDYGKDPGFLDRIHNDSLWYLAEVLPQTMVWQTRPRTAVPDYTGRGQPPKRECLVEGEAPPMTIHEIVERLQPEDWSPYVIKEGAPRTNGG